MADQPRQEVEAGYSEARIRAAVIAELREQFGNIIEDGFVIDDHEARRIAEEVIRRLRRSG